MKASSQRRHTRPSAALPTLPRIGSSPATHLGHSGTRRCTATSALPPSTTPPLPTMLVVRRCRLRNQRRKKPMATVGSGCEGAVVVIVAVPPVVSMPLPTTTTRRVIVAVPAVATPPTARTLRVRLITAVPPVATIPLPAMACRRVVVATPPVVMPPRVPLTRARATTAVPPVAIPPLPVIEVDWLGVARSGEKCCWKRNASVSRDENIGHYRAAFFKSMRLATARIRCGSASSITDSRNFASPTSWRASRSSWTCGA
jgi:hypothetical protein